MKMKRKIDESHHHLPLREISSEHHSFHSIEREAELGIESENGRLVWGLLHRFSLTPFSPFLSFVAFACLFAN